MKGIRRNLKFDSELLYVAALFHDMGLVDAYHTETKRFEVDGADAAREFLRSHGIPEPKAGLSNISSIMIAHSASLTCAHVSRAFPGIAEPLWASMSVKSGRAALEASTEYRLENLLPCAVEDRGEQGR
jgi:hypothetical protein